MEPWKMGQQVIDFYRAAFNNSFKVMNMLQERNEKVVELFLDQSAWLPDEGRRAITDWIGSCGKARGEFRRMVDESFKSVKDFFGILKTDQAVAGGSA